MQLKTLHIKIIFIVIFTLLIGSMIFWLAKNKGLRDYQAIASNGELRVETNLNTIDYFIKNDTVQGFQYELVKAFCDSFHLKPVWSVENSLQKSIENLQEGKIDLIARNIPITSEMREDLAFSIPILQVPQVLVQRKAKYNDSIEPIRSQLMLAGKTICVPESSPNILRLKNLSNEIADTIYIREMPRYEAEQLMMMVAKRDIDYTVCDLQTAKKNAALMPELDIETAISFTQMQAWAMRPASPELKQKVDSFLVNFLQTKQYRDIYRKYYK